MHLTHVQQPGRDTWHCRSSVVVRSSVEYVFVWERARRPPLLRRLQHGQQNVRRQASGLGSQEGQPSSQPASQPGSAMRCTQCHTHLLRMPGSAGAGADDAAAAAAASSVGELTGVAVCWPCWEVLLIHSATVSPLSVPRGSPVEVQAVIVGHGRQVTASGGCSSADQPAYHEAKHLCIL